MKERIDIYYLFDTNIQQVVSITKLTFEAKNKIYQEIDEILNLYLNTENININYINYKIIQKKNFEEKILKTRKEGL